MKHGGQPRTVDGELWIRTKEAGRLISQMNHI